MASGAPGNEGDEGAPTGRMEGADSAAGGPFIPGGAEDHGTPDEHEVRVQVEVRRGAGPIAAALVADANAFVAAAAAGADGGAASNLSAVLLRNKLVHARYTASPERIRAEQQRLADLQVNAAFNASAAEHLRTLEQIPALTEIVELSFPADAEAEGIAAELRRLPEISRAVVVPTAAPPMMSLQDAPPAEPLIGGGPQLGPRDPTTGLETQWYLHRARVPHAWRVTRGSGVVIADIDWGYRVTHQELRDGITRKYNSVDGSADVSAGRHVGHGTAVLGIAGARANGIGMAGFAPDAELWAVQGNAANGQNRNPDPWAEAIEWVRRTPSNGRRKVIVFEVQTGVGGNYEQLPSVHRAIRAAIADGCVVCVAAGNGDRAADQTDAGEPFEPTGSILVGATAYDPVRNARAHFSNHGQRIVVSAPGDLRHDLTCGPTSDFAYVNGFGGTSGATPKVAGTAALMLSVNPNLTHAEIRDILAGTGTRVEEDPGKPVGVFLNTEAAVAEALRRRGEAIAPEPIMTPTGEHAPEPVAPAPRHGVSRRRGQFALPDDPENAEAWSRAEAPAESEPGEAVFATTELRELRDPVSGDKTLRRFRQTCSGTLTHQDRLLILDQAIKLLDNFYVHRALKEALHAVRPIQRLRVLHRRMQQSDASAAAGDELAFHNVITQVFNSVRDLHTNYQLPKPYSEYIAYLPFEIAAFHEDGRRRYVVTRVVPAYQPALGPIGLVPGSEIIYWAGMPVERAVLASADETAGSNEAARHARGVTSLTLRPMNTALPPDADFVDFEFVPPNGAADTALIRMRQHWFVRYAPMTGADAHAGIGIAAIPPPPPSGAGADMFVDVQQESIRRGAAELYGAAGAEAQPPVPTPASATHAIPEWMAALGLDNTADSAREARQLLFEAEAVRIGEAAPPNQQVDGVGSSASPSSLASAHPTLPVKVVASWSRIFRAHRVTVAGKDYGLIEIGTFVTPDPEGFVDEFVRLLADMPPSGLIIDVRGNGGGHIWAAERLLQTLTPERIEPERMQFIATPGTTDLCRNNMREPFRLEPWHASLESAIELASTYSLAYPMTDPQTCNSRGQQYYGPVVLLVDGNSYSATDILAAGFQDHGIGKVLGVANATGAGGANVWTHSLLTSALPFDWGLKPLPNGAGMRVALRQSLRIGGTPLEDFGVVPDRVHPPTRADVLEGDRDLLEIAAGILSEQSVRSIKVEFQQPGPDGQRPLYVRTLGLDQLDIYRKERPRATEQLDNDEKGEASWSTFSRPGDAWRFVGFVDGEDRPKAVCRVTTP